MINQCAPAVVVLLTFAESVQAGFLIETVEELRKSTDAVVLATMEDVLELGETRTSEGLFGGTRDAYAFRLNVREVLHGERRAEVFVPREFFKRPQPGGAQWPMTPANGAKVWAMIARRKDGDGWEVLRLRRIERFDGAFGRTWRKIGAYWDLEGPAERLDILRTGCKDADPGFQSYCCGELARLSHGSEEALPGLERAEALSLAFEAFMDSSTPLEVLDTCDGIMAQHLGRSWKAHSARYDVLSRAVRVRIRLRNPPEFISPDGGEADSSRFLRLSKELTGFPGRAEETFRLAAEMLESDTQPYYPNSALLLFSALYQPRTPDPAQRRLNEEIWSKLVELMSGEAYSEEAAIAISAIAERYMQLGEMPEEVLKALHSEDDGLPPLARWHLRHTLLTLEKLKAAALTVRATGVTNFIGIPSQALVGRKVAVRGSLHDPTPDEELGMYAPDVEVSRRAQGAWIELDRWWPEGRPVGTPHLPPGTPLVIVGTLVRKSDLPVFDWKPGVPFGHGLPVPPGYSADEIRTRYVLTDTEWNIAPLGEQ